MASKEANKHVRPGDSVEIIRGQQSGSRAMVVINCDETVVVDIAPLNSELNAVNQRPVLLEIPLDHIRRVFRVGDNIRVRDGVGEHAGSSGCVIEVLDNGQRLSYVEDKTQSLVSPCVSINVRSNGQFP